MEGKLIIDPAEAPGITREGAASLELAMRALGDDVRVVEIEAAPRLLVEHLADAKPLPRAVVVSPFVYVGIAVVTAIIVASLARVFLQ